jgi:3-oxoadipate enol-lactonase
MPIAQLPDSETFYMDEGSGTPLVMIHGMGGDHTVWDPQARVLADRFRVVRPDNLGHGRSTKPAGPWRFSLFAQQIAQLLDRLEIERAVVCGFSLGGSISQAFSIEHPDRVLGLIVVSSVCARTDAEQAAVERRVAQVAEGGPSAVVEGAMKRWFNDAFSREHPDIVEYWRRKLLSNQPAPYLDAYRLYADVDPQLLHRLGAIKAPTLIVTGDNDPGQTPRMAQEMANRIECAEVRIFPGIAHMSTIEAADDLNGAIVDFVERRAIGG